MIPSKYLPARMWRDSVLYPPGDVNDLYEAKLREMGLLDQALNHDRVRGNHGGESAAETNAHFFSIYLNSVTLIQCVLLDPHEAFERIPRDLFVTLSSHRVSILDIPCGAGAETISILGTLKELRVAGILPTTPLTVRILGADISPHALRIYEDQLERLKPTLAGVGIAAELETLAWDATDVQQTNALMDRFIQISPTHNPLVLISNISGASGDKTGDFDKFKDTFRQIWIRLSNTDMSKSTIVWVEPDLNASKNTFICVEDLVDSYKWFQPVPGASKPLSCKYRWFLSIKNKVINKGSARIQSYTRVK